MKFSDSKIDMLRRTVGERLSEKRFHHTLGVEKMALHIGAKIMPERLSELSVAALLHDISKEYSEAEQLKVVKKHNIVMTYEDLSSPQLWHSMTAAYVILDEFSEFATEDVLSSVTNHTTGSPDMSDFDSIILLSDYIEQGRKYERCVTLRESFISELDSAKDRNEAIMALNRAVFTSLENNINEFISRGVAYHSKTKATRDAFLSKIKR